MYPVVMLINEFQQLKNMRKILFYSGLIRVRVSRNDLLNKAKEIRTIMKNIVPMNLTKEQEQEFKASTKCYLCGVDYKNDDAKVRDHDHLTGDSRSSAHQSCNAQFSWKDYKIPVIFHNLKGNDSHFLISRRLK